MIPLWDVVHRSPEERNLQECSSLCWTKIVAVCELLGSSDNEDSGNDFRRWCDSSCHHFGRTCCLHLRGGRVSWAGKVVLDVGREGRTWMGTLSELMGAGGSLKVFPSLYVFHAFILLTPLSSFLLIHICCKGHQLPFIHILLQ
jgi:hypothetical protein